MRDCGGHHFEISELGARLRRQARKLTGQRQAILEALRHSPHPLSIKEIFGALGRGDCDLATVYRSMHVLESAGMVKRYDFGDGAARFELVGEGDDGHHHHLVCTRCDQVVELQDCSMLELEKRIAALHGFQGVTHKLEFFGICPSCRH